MSEACATCSHARSCDKDTEHCFLVPANKDSHIGRVIAVMSGKGGVGKSFVTGVLACELQRAGKRVAVLDADVTGPSIPRAFGLHGPASGSEAGIDPSVSATGIEVMSLNLLTQNETDPVIWRGPVISGTVKQFWSDVVWGDVDVMLVDMPPGTGDVPLTVFQSLPVDGIVLVTSPQDLVAMIVEKAARMAETMEVPLIGAVENLSYLPCPHCGETIRPFGTSNLAVIAEKYGISATAELPIDPAFSAAVDAGRIEDLHIAGLENLVTTVAG